MSDPRAARRARDHTAACAHLDLSTAMFACTTHARFVVAGQLINPYGFAHEPLSVWDGVTTAVAGSFRTGESLGYRCRQALGGT